ncbi:MAG: hypothetical protein WBM66_03820, partial [Thiothrix litoralis]
MLDPALDGWFFHRFSVRVAIEPSLSKFRELADLLRHPLKGNIALDFTRTLLEQLEQCSFDDPTLNTLRKKYPDALPERLTACAGIAYIKFSQPFFQGYQLASSLCDAAKDKAKSLHLPVTPSAISFHRVTASLITHYDDLLKRELMLQRPEAADNIQLTLQPYYTGATHENSSDQSG